MSFEVIDDLDNEYEAFCPKCNDVLGGSDEPNDNPKDYDFVVRFGCVDCCIEVIHKYPTEDLKKRVYDEIVASFKHH
jgi:hypothetical protein